MQSVYMNVRCKEILQLLLKSESHIPLQKISEALHVSKRSIYYDLCKINEWLSANGIPELEVVRGKGILIEPDIKEQIEACDDQSVHEDNYILSPMERAHVIICSIIYAQDPVYIDQLMEECIVSRNTIFNDLRIVVNQLQDHDLKLEYESKKGYVITGDAIRIRAVFLITLNELHAAFEAGVVRFVDKEKVANYFEQLKFIEEALGTRYVEGTLRSLAVLMPVMERGNAELYFPNLKREELEDTKEYILIRKFFPEFDEKEQIYLCLHLLGSRVAVASNDIFENHPNQTVYEITKALVAEFEKLACVVFEDREELERALFVHINSSMYRYQFGIQIADSMCEDIIREYPDLFEITRIVSRYIEKQIGLPIPDGEVAYLALHFGAHLSVSSRESSSLRILIVCANGISTGNMLKRELQKMLPAAEIVGVIASSSIQKLQNKCDIIVSTVKLKSSVPVILVHPILTDMERETILNHPKVRGIYTGYSPEKIFQIVKPYVDETNYEKVKKDLIKYLSPGGETLGKIPAQQGLMDYLLPSHIAIHDTDCSWMRAIREAGECLEAEGCIEYHYLDRIISQIQYYGPYMFIIPRVVLAHAKPEDGVNRLGISLHLYQKGIEFTEFRKANIIIVLAAEDQESHLKILKDIVSIFSIQTRVDDLLGMKDADEIREYLSKILE